MTQSNPVTIQAPDAPATGKQWGMIKALAREAGYAKATEAIIAVFGYYEKRMLNRARASAVIEALKCRAKIESTDRPLAIEPPKATPQIDAMPGFAPLGMRFEDTPPPEPEFLFETPDEPTNPDCEHWGSLVLSRQAIDPDDDSVGHETEIHCGTCGTIWSETLSKAASVAA